MTDPNVKNHGFITRVLAELRRDPKKASVFGVLAVVLLILCVREVANRVGSPRAGSAATAQAGMPGDGMSLRRPVAKTPGGADVQGGQSDLLTGMPSLSVDRDIFTPKETYFPINRPAKPGKPVVATIVDPKVRQEAVRRQVQAQAQTLLLQSTVTGAVSTAIINGRVLHVGDWINEFQVVEITSRYCRLEKSGIRVMLEMAN